MMYFKCYLKAILGIQHLSLGVISTLGSQISLFTMTVLSVIRMYGLTCKPMRVPGPVTKKSVIKLTSLGVAIITAALAIAITPLVPSLEDYFVQGVYYDPTYKVFLGFPNKDRHVRILQTYYNQNQTGNATEFSSAMSWKDIGEKVDGMFTQNEGQLTRKAVHFYGNDGVCLFKYFVRTDDARRSRQPLATGDNASTSIGDQDPIVWTMLAANLFCFIIITGCYIVITLKTRQSSRRSGQQDNEERQKNERAIQNKIMIIIATDFLCWVPFIVISALHNLAYIDASSWYVIFAMTVLPLNSVVNPLVYDKALGDWLTRIFVGIKEFLRLRAMSIVTIIMSLFRTETAEVDPAGDMMILDRIGEDNDNCNTNMIADEDV